LNAKRKRDNEEKRGRGRESEDARTKLWEQSHVLNIPTQRAAASRRPALLRRRRVSESPFGGCCRCCEVGGERGRMGGVVERGWRDDTVARRGAVRSLRPLSSRSPPSVFHPPHWGFLYFICIYIYVYIYIYIEFYSGLDLILHRVKLFALYSLARPDSALRRFLPLFGVIRGQTRCPPLSL